MRYEVKELNGRFHVQDQVSGELTGNFPNHEKAEKLAKECNDMPTKEENPERKWVMAVCKSFTEREQIMSKGYEPFAVDAGYIFFKKPFSHETPVAAEPPEPDDQEETDDAADETQGTDEASTEES